MLLPSLHPVVAALACLAFQAWDYVAVREVLGGIDENGTPEETLKGALLET